jgi:ubiquinone/menaquinone biosynthesis C-methylase UbiE
MSEPQPENRWNTDEAVQRFRQHTYCFGPAAPEQRDVMVHLLSALGRPIRRVLDIGCGTGRIASIVLEAFPDAGLCMIDFAPKMLEGAREHFAQAGYAERVELIETDFSRPGWTERLPAPAEYDAVVSGFAIHHLRRERKREIYEEIFGLLAPGGMLLNLEWVASPGEWNEDRHDTFMAEALHPTGFFDDKPIAEVLEEMKQREDRVQKLLEPVETQVGWLREIGYADADCYLKCFELALLGGRRPGGA